MKRTLYIFLLLLPPLFVKAGDPIKCACASDEKGANKLGLLHQYHEMLLSLEKAGQTEAVKNLYKIYDFKIAQSSTPKQMQDSFALLVLYCEKIAGSNKDDFMAKAQEIGLIQNENKISNLDSYKARLACVAVQVRGDTLPPLAKAAEMESKVRELEEKVEVWKTASIGASVAFLFLAIGAYFFWEREKRKLEKEHYKRFDDIIKTTSSQQPGGNVLANTSESVESQIKISEPKLPAEPASELKPDSIFSGDPPASSTSSPPPAASVVAKKIYAGLPNGSLLYRTSSDFEPQSTYFVIQVNPDQRTGKFSLVDDPATRLHAFSMMETLRNACELQSTGTPTSAQVGETSGKVELEGEYWVIKDKIKLKW